MADVGLKMELVTAQFNAMLADLSRIDPRIDFPVVVRAEAAAVAAGAMTRTKAASVAKINARAQGRKFTTFNGKVYYLGNRYPDTLWNPIDQQNKDSLQTKLRARGISKQSWLHLARSMGRAMKAPAYVIAANYKGQQYPLDGTSAEDGSAMGFTLTVVNSSPTVQQAGGAYALIGAMSARSRYFERNMAHSFFRTVESRAKKYPGIFADPVPAPASSPAETPIGS